MSREGMVQSIHLVSSQLEAASTLLKYAADDLRELTARGPIPMARDIDVMAQNILIQSASLDGNAAFCERWAEEIASLEREDASAVG